MVSIKVMFEKLRFQTLHAKDAAAKKDGNNVETANSRSIMQSIK